MKPGYVLETAMTARRIRELMVGDRLRRRSCRCGCRNRATYAGMVDGTVLTAGCELSMRRWRRCGWATPPAYWPALPQPGRVLPFARVG